MHKPMRRKLSLTLTWVFALIMSTWVVPIGYMIIYFWTKFGYSEVVLWLLFFYVVVATWFFYIIRDDEESS